MLEIEKKWLMKQAPGFTSLGFKSLGMVQITQTYLNENERIRQVISEWGRKTSYQHFTKTRVDIGSCVESLTIITEAEYDAYWLKGIRQVRKTRETWLDPSTGLHYEYDVLKFSSGNRNNILLLEVEFQDKYKTMEEVDANFTLPKEIDDCMLFDATDNPRMSNYALAYELTHTSVSTASKETLKKGVTT
jgi:hypothetical protein